ncbi:MAG: aminomethyl-transferring glycine dehydrogenase subunit GcvPA [Candidatus Izemoplasmatales bacterium]
MFKYFPHTDVDLEEMKSFLNIQETKELFKNIPSSVLFEGEYNLDESMSEEEIRRYFSALAKQNTEYTVFAGGGFYDHYQPSVINSIVSRQEFLTAYTPYQPEIAQGTLTYIFEYQSMIQTLTGLDVSNASMYDGTTATAEAMFMACSITKRNKVLIPNNVNPVLIEVVKTYAHFKGIDVEVVPSKNGCIDIQTLSNSIDSSVAGVIVQKPNYFGIVEDFEPVGNLAHLAGALLIENADISTLGVLKTPGEDGADIAVGDCQALGMPLSFGGPTLGYMATTKKHVRKMPGRICGLSYDALGKRAFVLTLQAREQHIRREKANSNICSNQSLMALYTTVYLSLLGPKGLKEVNERSYEGAHYLYHQLLQTGKFYPAFDAPFLKEFVINTHIPHELIDEVLKQNGILGGLSLSHLGEEFENMITFAVTEKRTKAEIDHLVQILGGLSW